MPRTRARKSTRRSARRTINISSPSVTVRELLAEHRQDWQLKLAAGAAGLGRRVAAPRIQQPGLALAGYLPQIHPQRLQVLGNSEVSYLGTLSRADARRAAAAVCAQDVACFVVTNGTPPPPPLLAAARARRVPVLATRLRTAAFIRAATAWLEERLAPQAALHADLVEVGGLGVLILGKSGIGKSEAALDLVSRGHRLVADDVVEVKRIGPSVLRGRAPQALGHHLEVRGLGIVDIGVLFGPLATVEEREIDLVVELVEWAAERLGLTDEETTLLEVNVPLVRIPVRPGRNVATLIEVAARNHLLKRRGHHGVRELAARLDRAIAAQGRAHRRKKA